MQIAGRFSDSCRGGIHFFPTVILWVSPVVKNPPANAGDERNVCSIPGKDTLEEEMALHSIILIWKIPWGEEPGRLQSMGLQRVGHN